MKIKNTILKEIRYFIKKRKINIFKQPSKSINKSNTFVVII